MDPRKLIPGLWNQKLEVETSSRHGFERAWKGGNYQDAEKKSTEKSKPNVRFVAS